MPSNTRREAQSAEKHSRQCRAHLHGIAIVLNLILLFAEDTSPGWPIAAVILLGAAGAALLSQRREP